MAPPDRFIASGGVMASPVLVVVDVQERLFNAMDAERRDDMVANV
jgi:hypothetical protein